MFHQRDLKISLNFKICQLDVSDGSHYCSRERLLSLSDCEIDDCFGVFIY